MKQKRTFPNVEQYRAAVDDCIEALNMRDHRGREILTASNFFTYIKHLYQTHGANWPVVFVADWRAQNEK